MTTKSEWDNRVEAEYQAGNLTPHYRAALLALLTFRGHSGRIFPTHTAIAARVVQGGMVRTCCVKTVERALEQARDLGMLWWMPQHRRVGWRKLRSSNLYFVNVPAGPVKSGRGRVWPRRSTDRQPVAIQAKEERKAADNGPVVTLAARRLIIEGRLADQARYKSGLTSGIKPA